MIPKFRAFYNGNTFEVTDILWRNGKIEYIRGILRNGRIIGGHKDTMDITKIKLMQYTDCPDKNQVEICQDDIISHKQILHPLVGEPNPIEDRMLVAFGEYEIEDCECGHVGLGFYIAKELHIEKGRSILRTDSKDLQTDYGRLGEGKVEVIGNIHENPELLETTK